MTVLLCYANSFFQVPQMIGDARFRRRSNMDGGVNPAEVVRTQTRGSRRPFYVQRTFQTLPRHAIVKSKVTPPLAAGTKPGCIAYYT